MDQIKKPYVIIPCSNCGDTLRLDPFQIEESEEIECPRCDHLFLPTDALMERINASKESFIERESEEN